MSKKQNKRVVLVTGGFDPLHSGHIKYITEAAKLGDTLVVGVNSDAWLTRKKGRPFMPWLERASVIDALKPVDVVIDFNDDNNSGAHAIQQVLDMYPDATIVYANGGDRGQGNIPEQDLIDDPRLEYVFGVGGDDKANSSSWILRNWQAPRTERIWGHYDVLTEYPDVKLKELVVEPGRCLSYQRHFQRSEVWFVRSGVARIIYNFGDLEYTEIINKHGVFVIPQEGWHQLINPGAEPLHIIEIQYGDACLEEDIERVNQ
jgi:cytidyltransferase-like protein